MDNKYHATFNVVCLSGSLGNHTSIIVLVCDVKTWMNKIGFEINHTTSSNITKISNYYVINLTSINSFFSTRIPVTLFEWSSRISERLLKKSSCHSVEAFSYWEFSFDDGSSLKKKINIHIVNKLRETFWRISILKRNKKKTIIHQNLISPKLKNSIGQN